MSTRNNHQIPFLAFLFIFFRSLVEQKNHVRFPFVIAIEKVEGIPHKDYNNLKYTERVLTGITWMLIKYKHPARHFLYFIIIPRWIKWCCSSHAIFLLLFSLKSLDATVSRLLAETRKLLEELEDVKCLDDIIDMLNSECIFKPIIHHEWISTYPLPNTNIPIDEGVVVSSA